MSDHLETEIKFHLPNPLATRRALLALGAIPEGLVYEMNIRLDDDFGSIEDHNMVLRVRTTRSEDGDEQHLLTVKYPEIRSDSLKSRREIELAIQSADAMLAVLEALGYTPFFRYEKRRETFRIHLRDAAHPIEVVIDELPYGWFMEIEGDEPAILALATALNLDPADALQCSYSRIFTNVVAALNLDLTDLTFDAFRNLSIDRSMFGC